MRRPYICIDPGKNGAIISRNTDNQFKLSTIPKIQNKVMMKELCLLFEEHMDFCTNNQTILLDPLVVIEEVHSIFGTGAKSNFEFGRIFGRLEGIAYSHLPVEYIQPKEWQKEVWSNADKIYKPKKENQKTKRIDPKKTSEMAFRRLFPNLDATPTPRSKKFHDGIMDAVLISEFAARCNL